MFDLGYFVFMSEAEAAADPEEAAASKNRSSGKNLLGDGEQPTKEESTTEK